MSQEKFTGSVTQMKSTKWLGSEDFIDRGEVEMTITGIYCDKGEVMQDGKKKDFFSVAFDKTEKRLVLNATNRKTLSFAFGAITGKWVGKKIKIYVQDGVKAIGGGTTTGLRIKTMPPAAAATPLDPFTAPAALPMPESADLEDMPNLMDEEAAQ